jgi:signal transduction histidine kinase
MRLAETWIFRQAPVRLRLAILVVACVLPLWLAASYLVYTSYQIKLDLVEGHMEETARALSQVVDRDMGSVVAALGALRTSPSLASGDLAAFHVQAREVLGEFPGADIILADLAGQQLVNTFKSFGEALPKRNISGEALHLLAEGRQRISGLFRGAVTGRNLISVDVPVLRDGIAALDLSMTFPADRFGAILRQQHLPTRWVGTILDAGRTVVARSHQSEKYVGQRIEFTRLSRSMETAGEDTIESVNLEGEPVFASYTRSDVTGWTVVISVPTDSIMAGIWNWLWWTVAGTSLFSVAGIVLAWNMANSIEQVIEKQKENEALRDDIERVTQHDLKSPLLSLTNGCMYLLDDPAMTPEHKRILTIMRDTGQRMLNSISVYFDILKMENRRYQINPVRIDLVEAVGKAWNEVKKIGDLKNLDLSFGVDGESAAKPYRYFVYAEETLILSMLTNLIRNAAEASPKDARIEVRLVAADGSDEIIITNQGEAPSEIRSRFFEKFVTFGKANGTGLGTYSAKLIAKSHGGDIELDASVPGRTTITVSLPQRDASGALKGHAAG